jgi:ectoine hydroxylase-related dioxygenase (phytanoyl-CoA dioxygenase family)
MLTQEQIDAYHLDGYIIAKAFLDAEEIDLLRRTAIEDRQLDQKAIGIADGEGGTVRLTLWNHPGNSIYGMIARSRRVVDAMEQLLDGEVYHYHSKMILKDAKIGGAWAWHQDYGYWYDNNVLYPLLSSVSIAVDPATRENGCMQVLKGSHHMGRMSHGQTGDQTGADVERVAEAEKRLELVYCEMEPGDALFFHCNTLHRSDQNNSDKSRWSLICCYNAARNDPYQEAHHPSYTPLEKVPDSAIKEVGMTRFEDDASDVAFMDPKLVDQADE